MTKARKVLRKPEMVEVDSSNLYSIGYDKKARKLYIDFRNGGSYVYYDVSWQRHRALMNAPSHGSYFCKHIRNNDYRYRRIDD